VSILINIGGSTFIPKDNFTIDRNKLEERDSGQVTVFNTRAQRYEPYDVVTIEVGTEQDYSFSTLGEANLITEAFTSSNIETDPAVTPLYVFDSVHNPIPANTDQIILQFEWNQNFLFKKQASFGGGVNIFSGILFFKQEGLNFTPRGEINFIDIFDNEVYGNGTVEVPEDTDHFTVRMVSVSTNPQGLQSQQLFLNSNETTFAVTVEEITITSYEQMLVQSDMVVKTRDGLYEHQINLIETIARFDGYYPADRIVSSSPPKTLSEVLDIYRRELELYHNLKINWDRRQAWGNTPVRQKEFIGVNFSVVVQDLFRGINAIPRALYDDGTWLIYPEFYNEKKQLIQPNPVSQVLQQDTLDYGTRIKSQIKNGIYERARERFFPSETGGVLPKSEGPQRIDSRLQYQLDSGIIEVTEALVSDIIVREAGTGLTNRATSGVISIDIANHILPKPFWDGRPTPVNQKTSGVHKKNSLYYDIGDRNIRNLFNAGTELLFFNFGDSVEVLRNAILESAYVANILVSLDTVNFIPIQDVGDAEDFEVIIPPAIDEEFLPDKIKIRFKYIPQRNIDIVHHRQFLKNMNEATQIHRQRDSLTEVERYKNTLKNLSNRMGNDVLQYIEIFENATPHKLGDYDEQGNVIVRVKNTYFNDYVMTEYLMAEGFGNIDTEASLWKEPSAFEIQGKDITTNIIIEEFIEISELDKDVTTRLTGPAQQSVLATLDNNITPTDPIQAAVMRPLLAEETEVSTNGLYLPVFTGGGGNTSSYHFRIDDPASAGRVFQDSFVDRLAEELVYTYQEADFLGEQGELREFRFYLVPDVGIDDTGFYPLIEAAQIQNFQTEALTQTNIIDTIDKDKNAKFAVTFQQHIVTDNPEVIIGPAFAKYNRLLTNEMLPSKIVYKSTVPFSPFDNRIRPGDVVSQGSWNVNSGTRQLTITTESTRFAALTYNGEIILAFNWEEPKTQAQYFINFVAQAERELINQLATPAPFSFSSNANSLQVAVTNVENEPVTLEATLQSNTQTEQVAANSGAPEDIQDATASFTFTNLEPNTAYQVQYKAIAIAPSEKQDSARGFFNINTTILPTSIPIFSENSVVLQTGDRYDARYNVTNNNTFPVEVFARVDGFEYSIGTLNANTTNTLTVNLSDDDQFIFENISYTIDLRFRTTTFTNNWFSNYTQEETLLITKLETPTYVSSSVTDDTATFVWKNNSNRTVFIEMDLFLEANGITGFVDTDQASAGAGLNATITFTGLQSLTPYKTNAKALQAGFRTESDLSPFSPTITTLEPTTARPNIAVTNRTINRIDFTFTNTDSSEVDIYWNTSGNPDENDNVLPEVGPTAPNNTASASVSGLPAGTVVTIYWRAKADGKLISSQGQTTTATLNQLAAPVFITSSVTATSLNVQWGNGNNVGATIETILQIGSSPVPNTVRTFFIDANDGGSVTYTGLSDNTTYNVRAKFLADQDSQESPDANSGLITTDKFDTANPSLTITNVGETSVEFDMTNNDAATATLSWGLGETLTNTASVTTNQTISRTLSNLSQNFDYTLRVQAEASGKNPSEIIEEPFTTLADFADEWELIAQGSLTQIEYDESIASTPSPRPQNCPVDSTEAETFINNTIDPTTRRIGHVVRVTRFANNPLICTTYFFAAVGLIKHSVRVRLITNIGNVTASYTIGTNSGTANLTTSYQTIGSNVTDGVGYSIEVPATVNFVNESYTFVRWRVNGNFRPVGENQIDGVVSTPIDLEAEYELAILPT
jgi:hypothetical protein